MLTQIILNHRLNKTPESEQVIVRQFIDQGMFHVVADPSTTPEEWENRRFGVATEAGELCIYSFIEDAQRAAADLGSVLLNGEPMARKISEKQARSLVSGYHEQGFITKVRIYGKAPISAPVDPRLFEDGACDAASQPEPPAPPVEVSVVSNEEDAEPKQEGFALVDEVRATLDMPLKEDRRKTDPAKLYENAHTLIDKLIQVNKLDRSAIDKELGLQDGFTKNFCKDQLGSNYPKNILFKYLSYFGLGEYLYLFKGQSDELRQELAENAKIDPFPIKRASGVKTPDEKKYLLISVQRGHHGSEKAYIYRMTFKKGDVEEKVILSSQFEMAPGREYELDRPSFETKPDAGDPAHNAANAKAGSLATAEEEAEALAKVQQKKTGPSQKQAMPDRRNIGRNTGKNRYLSKTEDEKAQEAMNTVIGYVKKTSGCSSTEAKAKLEQIAKYPEIVAEFARYINKDKGSKYNDRGWNAKRLMHELRYSPLEAFQMLADLKADPQKTLERLKYRQTDPQYQKKPKDGEK